MGFVLSLFRNTDDPKCLVKKADYTNRIKQYNDVTFKQGRSLRELTIDLKEDRSNATYEGVFRATYASLGSSSISGFRNYFYFIDRVESLPTGFLRLHLREDVLMSFSNELKALNCTLDRSETIFNGYLPDSEYTALGYRAIVCKAFPDALDDDSYILMTTG